MTLIVVAGNADQVVIAADTRLSWNGTPVDDATCKICQYKFYDGCLASAYSGLVKFGGVVVKDYILDVLADKAKPWTKAFEALDQIENALTEKFKTDAIAKIPAEQRGFSIVFGGYIDGVLALASISNCLDIEGNSKPVEDKFSLTTWTHPTTSLDYAVVQGATGFVRDGVRQNIYQMAKERKPADAIKGKCHSVILDVAKTANSVNANILTCTLRPDGVLSVWYSPEDGVEKYILADGFSSMAGADGGAMTVRDAQLQLPSKMKQRMHRRGKVGMHSPRSG